MMEGQNFEFVAPSSRLKSSVWQYFGFYKIKGSDETHFDRTLCKLCNNLLAYNSGCTTNMRHHLIRSHKIVPEGFTSSDTKTVGVKKVSGDKQLKATRKHIWLDKVDENIFEIVSAPSSMKALVWQHFGFYKITGTDEVKMDRTWCKLCDTFITYSGGNTTNMRSHLARHHNIYLESVYSSSGPPAISPPPTDRNDSVSNDSVGSQDDPKFSKDDEFVDPKPSLKALVWNYFGFYKKKGTNSKKFEHTCCRLCKTLIRYIGGSTTNMRSHLQRTHHLDVDALPAVAEKSSIVIKSDESSIADEPAIAKDAPPVTFKQLKKILRKQCCSNSSCRRPIQLESDGSPPQFCGGCGLLLSTLLSEMWTDCTECCQLCGKVKEPTLDTHFCSRCGGYLASEVEVFPHSSDAADALEGPSLFETSPDSHPKAEHYEGESSEAVASSSQSNSDMSEGGNQIDDTISSDSSTTSNDSGSVASRECDFCSYKTADVQQFASHLKSHFELPNSASQSDMNESGELFDGAGDDQKDRLHDLIEHIKEQKQPRSDMEWDADLIESMAGEGSNFFECFACDFMCVDKAELDAHTVCHKNENVKTSRRLVRYCRKCNEEFRTLFLLRKHEKAASCKEKVLACDECDFMTTKVSAFRGHRKRNHGKIVLKKCDYCDRMFKRQRNLDEHMNTHTGSTPFQCDKCGKAFHTNSSWYKHKRNNCKKGSRERKLCSHCGREVINLSKHISDVHFNIKDFHCEKCKKSFGTQYHLDRHMRTHTGEKPFPCKFCDYRASQKVVTDSHMKKCKYRVTEADTSNDILDTVCAFDGLPSGHVLPNINPPV